METAMSGFWIDRGGTFTDIVARAPDGALSPQAAVGEPRSATATPPSPASATCWACARRADAGRAPSRR
jgi:N-methylhydantoinase A/oxoprolinase/acetone carboxylase beta subunit